jgi:hypothetical protein
MLYNQDRTNSWLRYVVRFIVGLISLVLRSNIHVV